MTTVSCRSRLRRPLYAALVILPLALAACAPETAAPGNAGKAAETSGQPVAAAEQVDSAVYRGATVARQVCAQCHDIGAGSGPAIYAGAPTFVSVADRPGQTPEALGQWLKSQHPSMPQYVFNDVEVEELVAYIMSLHKPAQ